MNKLIIASAAAALMMGVSVSAYAQATPADCQSLFQRADVNKDGSLQAEEAKVFIDAMNQAQVKPQDASLVKQDEFMQACQKNAFANIDPATIGTAASGTAASTETTTTGQGTTTTDQSASGTVTTDQSATGTTATTDQSATGTTTTTDQGASGTATTTTTTTDQTASTDTTQQQAGQQEQALAAPSGLLASNIIGSTVYSQDNQSIGDINDIILSQEGQPSQVIVGVGGFLGIGEKDVVLDMSKLQIAATEDGNVKIVTQTSQDELRDMPPFMRPAAQQQQ
jgi:PRC-barrel domain